MKPLQLTKSMQSAKLNWRQILFAGLLIGSLFCSPVVTLFAGILFALTLGNPFPVWSKKASKKLLQYCVVGLGFGMNFHESLAAGREGMTFTVVSVVTVMIVGVVLGRLLRIDRKNSYLISSGTAICGGSAIAAVAPVIDADENQTSLSLATIFILNAVALFVFPVIGHWLGMGQTQFGTWAAIAIHDTSSVVGAGAAYGEEALKASVDFSVRIQLPPSLPLGEPQLCSIFGNLLENALDACRECTDSAPFIRICAQEDAGHIVIAVDNTCCHPPIEENGRFRSTKHDGFGTGTASIRSIAERYQGLVDFRYEDGIFYASVMLKFDSKISHGNL